MANSTTKATEISQATRIEVYDRQGGMSPFGNWLGRGCEYHHVIGSGLGIKGVGYEWNVVALAPEEHRAIHDRKGILVNGKERYTYQEAITIMKNHLKINYPNWSEDRCKVHKGWEKEDYEVIPRDKRP